MKNKQILAETLLNDKNQEKYDEADSLVTHEVFRQKFRDPTFREELHEMIRRDQFFSSFWSITKGRYKIIAAWFGTLEKKGRIYKSQYKEFRKFVRSRDKHLIRKLVGFCKGRGMISFGTDPNEPKGEEEYLVPNKKNNNYKLLTIVLNPPAYIKNGSQHSFLRKYYLWLPEAQLKKEIDKMANEKAYHKKMNQEMKNRMEKRNKLTQDVVDLMKKESTKKHINEVIRTRVQNEKLYYF